MAVSANYTGTGASDYPLELTNTSKRRHQNIRKIYLNFIFNKYKPSEIYLLVWIENLNLRDNLSA